MSPSSFDESLLTAYLDQELTSDERRLVEQELARSPDARRQLAELTQVREWVARIPAPTLERSFSQGPWTAPSLDATRRVAEDPVRYAPDGSPTSPASHDSAPSSPARVTPSQLYPWMLALAATVLVAGSGLWIWLPLSNSESPVAIREAMDAEQQRQIPEPSAAPFSDALERGSAAATNARAEALPLASSEALAAVAPSAPAAQDPAVEASLPPSPQAPAAKPALRASPIRPQTVNAAAAESDRFRQAVAPSSMLAVSGQTADEKQTIVWHLDLPPARMATAKSDAQAPQDARDNRDLTIDGKLSETTFRWLSLANGADDWILDEVGAKAKANVEPTFGKGQEGEQRPVDKDAPGAAEGEAIHRDRLLSLTFRRSQWPLALAFLREQGLQVPDELTIPLGLTVTEAPAEAKKLPEEDRQAANFFAVQPPAAAASQEESEATGRSQDEPWVELIILPKAPAAASPDRN